MKTVIPMIIRQLGSGLHRRNFIMLAQALGILMVLVVIYTIIFHYIMLSESREYSWITGLYWTLTVMSTLGFGDITFASDLGKVFSLFVLLSGILFLLVLLPFTFIEFFYEPWVKAQAAARIPRGLHKGVSGHIILTQYESVESALIEKLKMHHYPYVIVMPEFEEALRLHDDGLNVVFGDLDDPDTYERAQIHSAALVATTRSEIVNTNIASTIREVSKTVPILASVRMQSATEILKLAGCTRIVDLGEMLGQMFARRLHGGKEVVHVIGEFDELLIGEVNAANTPFVGKTLIESDIRHATGLNLVGAWTRGRFEPARPNTVIEPQMVLVMAGSRDQMDRFEKVCTLDESVDASVVIIGGGRVGRAASRWLEQQDIDYRIVEKVVGRVKKEDKVVLGNALEPQTLERAGINKAPCVMITTHDDDTNIYLTIYCRCLLPNIQIITRCSYERNINTLHRAGADFVVSYASMGATAIFNLLKRSGILMVAEGLDIIKMKVPPSLEGKTLSGSSVRRRTGCSIIGLISDGFTVINPDPDSIMHAGDHLMLIGDDEAERKFLAQFG